MKAILPFSLFFISYCCLFSQSYPDVLANAENITYEGDMVKEFSLKFDNDLLTGWIDGEKSDDDYTTGVKLDWRLRYLHTPLFLGFGENDFDQKGEGREKNFIRNSSRFSVGSYFYTPKDLSRVDVDSTDRPYAGFQYLGFGRVSDRKRLNKDMISNHYSKIATELQIGLIGGPLSENLQNWVHRFAVPVSENPQGWANQIGGKSGTFAINYHLAYEVLWLSLKAKQKRKKRPTPDGYNVYNVYQPANALVTIGANLGNFRSDFSFGLKVNLFNWNQTSNYFLNFYDHDKADNYPSGPGPYLNIPRGTPKIFHPKDAGKFSANMNDRNLTEERFQFKNLIPGIGDPHQLSKKEVYQMLLDSAYNRIFTQTDSTGKTIEYYDIINKLRNAKSGNTLGDILSDEELEDIERYVYLKERPGRDYRPLVDTVRRYYNRRWEFSMFIEPQFRWVGYNGMLQGVLFDKDEYYTVRVINPFVYEARVGFQLKYDFMKIELTASVRSKEFVSYPANEFPGIGQDAEGKNWHKWGAINFYYYPNLLRKRIDRFSERRKLKGLNKTLPTLVN